MKTPHEVAETILAELDFYDGATSGQAAAAEGWIEELLTRWRAEAVAAEREACAHVAEDWRLWSHAERMSAPDRVAKAIRARGGPPRVRIAWQCSYCAAGFPPQRWADVCPACGGEGGWSGSVYPDAKLWDGAIRARGGKP